MGQLPLKVSARIAARLDEICAEFKPGAKITLLVRNPSVPGDADFVMTNDRLEEAISGLQHRLERRK